MAGLPPLGDLNSAVDIINRAFDECKFIFFIVQPPQSIMTGSSETGVESNLDLVNLTIAPNPFQSQTDIRFSLTFESKVSVEIYNMIGVKVATLFEGNASAGQVYTYTFKPADNASQQAYLCVVRTSQGNTVKRMLLSR
jgi:hypothetical protein